jgi:hypothetical protein
MSCRAEGVSGNQLLSIGSVVRRYEREKNQHPPGPFANAGASVHFRDPSKNAIESPLGVAETVLGSR